MDTEGPLKRLVLGVLVALLVACSGNREPDIATLASNSDQIIWEAGQKAFEKKLWDNARQHFRRIIDAFPQSEFGPAARLALGDTYFREGGGANYILAVSAYQDFLTLFPSHARADYAQFQVAEGHFKQRNAPDRDQTPTQKALEEFLRLLDRYPQSEHIETARQRIATCRQSLARAEFLVGVFYQRTRVACASAIPRYEVVVSDYPDFEQYDEALYRLADCLGRSGRAAEALPQLARLIEDYPNSALVDDARRLMATLQAQGTPGAAGVPAPSAAAGAPRQQPSPSPSGSPEATPPVPTPSSSPASPPPPGAGTW
jgi:outer membrane protein assembly factor BamD